MSITNKIFEFVEPLTAMTSGLIEGINDDFDSYFINSKPFITRTYLRRRSKNKDEEYSIFFDIKKKPKLFSCYLQRFHCDDDREKFHNHPWMVSYSLILTNGYIEHRLVDGQVVTKTFRPGSVNKIHYDDFHYIELLNKSQPCVTLMFAGPIVQEWGYYDIKTKIYKRWFEQL